MKCQHFSSGQAVTGGKGPNGGVSVVACLTSMEPIGRYNNDDNNNNNNNNKQTISRIKF